MHRSLKVLLFLLFFFGILLKVSVGQTYAASTYINCKCDDATGSGHTAKCTEQTGAGQGKPVAFTCPPNVNDRSQNLYCADAPGSNFINTPQQITAYGITCKPTKGGPPPQVNQNWKNCKCATPNQIGGGKNKYTCDGGKENYCLNINTMCVSGGSFTNTPAKHVAEGITCQSVTSDCTCQTPDTPTKNAFTCKSPQTTQPISCGVNRICKNSPNNLYLLASQGYKGISCDQDPNKDKTDDTGKKEEDAKATLWPTSPPPPSPPCVTFVDGKCTVVKTAFGDISTEPGKFITKVFGILLSVSGGLALFLIMRASYIIMTSRGKPEQLQNGRDQLIAAVVGLFFLIFSFVILQVIGTDILKIPTDTTTPAAAKK